MPDGQHMMLEATRVTHTFHGVRVLDEVSLAVGAGNCLALVGESGAGKTTLLRCFNRMVLPQSGDVRVAGLQVSIGDAPALRRRIGYVPQQGGLLPHWTVLRNVAMVPELLRDDDSRAKAHAAMEHVGLPPAAFAQRYPDQLSGGERQRVALARAIAARQEVLLLDEPFAALDAISRSTLQTVCATLRRELRITMLLVSHDLIEADYLADEIAVMRLGKIEQVGTLDTLLGSPATPYVASLLTRALRGRRLTPETQ